MTSVLIKKKKKKQRDVWHRRESHQKAKGILNKMLIYTVKKKKGIPGATESWKRQRMDSPLEPLARAQPY